MNILERHMSQDGLLKLIVDFRDGDWTVGFEDLPWHTHGDILTHEYGGTPEEAVRAFVDDILASRRVIVISRIDNRVDGAWVTDSPCGDELKYAAANETIEKRFWNGTPYSGSPRSIN